MIRYGVNYKIDKIPPKEEGDGLPNISWRLRVILAFTLGGAVAWGAVIFLI